MSLIKRKLNKINTRCSTLNNHELNLRQDHQQVSPFSIYWPEPHTYMSYQHRLREALNCLDNAQTLKNSAQQKEDLYYLPHTQPSFHACFDKNLTLTNPVKTRLDPFFRNLIGYLKK